MSLLLQSATPLPNYELALVMTNGEHRRFDVKPYLDKGVFKALQDPEYFNQVQSHPRFVQWPKGQDLGLDTLLVRSIHRDSLPA